MRRGVLALATAIALFAGATAALADSQPRIVGGTVAPEGAYPTVVSISETVPGVDEPGFSHVCGGTLIGPTTVLTASHCVGGAVPGDHDVIVGRENLSDTEDGERIPVIHYSTHPAGADAALLELERPVEGEPTALATSADASAFATDATATAVGWGMKGETSNPSMNLREVDLSIVSDGDCKKAYRKFGGMHMMEMICAGAPGKDTCGGDSGGPLFAHGPDGTILQVGVTSFGRGCARARFPGVYTEIPAILDFITDPAPVWAPVPEAGAAKIRGDAEVGERLRCDEGDWEGEDVEFRYAWTAGYDPRPVSRKRTFVPGPEEAGEKLSCSVVGMNRGGFVDLASGTVRVRGDGRSAE
jgi:secreted trypsin-like serine protease